MNEDYLEEADFPLQGALEAAIVMHRDAHFGGQFPLMLEYYAAGGKGIQPEFELSKIQELADTEMRLKQNLAGILLSGSDAEKVARVRETYQNLRGLYDSDEPFSKHPKLIADLILTESEEGEEEIAAIVKEKSSIVNALIEVIRSEDLHDPLFPGYGLAPALAVKCLGLIGDKRSISILFEAVDSGDFFDEEIALNSLKEMGEPAKEFLLRVLEGHPYTGDNEKAALALIKFKEDPKVVKKALALLKDPKIQKLPIFPVYLVLICEELADPTLQKEFQQLLENETLPSSLRREMQTIQKTFR